jgi:hypothetical protein
MFWRAFFFMVSASSIALTIGLLSGRSFYEPFSLEFWRLAWQVTVSFVVISVFIVLIAIKTGHITLKKGDNNEKNT